MSVFQWLAVPLLSVVLLLDATGLLRSGVSRWARAFRCAVWVAAIIAILHPEWLQEVATALGIGRAADLVFYLFALAFLMVSFFFYARYVRLQRQITDVVRYLAIREARREPAEGQR
jgi:hypothetical protein